MQMNVMKISIEDHAKAFRINGVPFAKRHLVNTMAKGCNGDMEKMIAKFLVIVPFLATAFQCPDTASPSVKYGAIKSKRLYKALGLTEESTVPFMLVCMAQAGEDIGSMGKTVREAGFYGERHQGDNVVHMADYANKPTFH